MMEQDTRPHPSRFQRFVLPGLAFKAVVIGGGYATGRELAEFFLSAGPRGGILAILLATIIFSLLCVITFLFARRLQTYDYRSFFKALLGPGWILFEFTYVLFVVLILAVYGAASGAIGTAVFGAPDWAGTVALMIGIAAIVAFGNSAVERLFRDVSYLLYGVYALFVVAALWTFGDRVPNGFATHPQTTGWVVNGVTYVGYNIIGAVVILPVLRHLVSDRDAVISGIIAGPLAMIPALLFLVPMVAFYPDILEATLPSDYLLQRIGIPAFHILFQVMIFSALLESGTSAVHAINERVDNVFAARRGKRLSHAWRLAIAVLLLIGCMLVAGRFGLVALIANGYRALGYIVLAIYVLPLVTLGIWKLSRKRSAANGSRARALHFQE